MDNIQLHMFDCAILYKTMENIHMHMFDYAMFDCYSVQDIVKHAPVHV